MPVPYIVGTSANLPPNTSLRQRHVLINAALLAGAAISPSQEAVVTHGTCIYQPIE